MSANITEKIPILTTHARTRMKERKIPESLVLQTLVSPDRSDKSTKNHARKYSKQFDKHRITVIAHTSTDGKRIAVSVWAVPPFAGSSDIPKKKRYQTYRSSTGMKKIALAVLHAFGLYSF